MCLHLPRKSFKANVDVGIGSPNHGAGRNDPARRQSTLIGPLKQTPVAPFAKKKGPSPVMSAASTRVRNATTSEPEPKRVHSQQTQSADEMDHAEDR